MNRMAIAVTAVCLCGAWTAAGQEQQPSPAAAANDRTTAAQGSQDDILGPVFESQSAGISFRRPAGGKEIHRAVPDEIVEFADEEQGWLLKVARTQLRQPMRLSNTPEKQGLLELTVAQLKERTPGAQILRQDVIKITGANVGMISLRYTVGTRRRLTQQALIAAKDDVYYVFTLTTPGSRSDQPDESETQAVELFRQVINSAKLLDTTAVRQDQEQRLFRTRALFVNLTEKRLRAALAPEQWWRLIQNGKDVGWTYVTEDVDDRPGGDGILIAVRAHTVPEAGVQVDVASRMSLTFDRKHETWSSVVDTQQRGQDKLTSTEFGATDRSVVRSLDNTMAVGETVQGKSDAHQPPVRQSEKYSLRVTHVTKKSNSPPYKVDQLPPWYLPQALGHLLPRVVPIGETKSYMFVSYVSDRGVLMSRYVEVGEPAEATLNGQTINAIAIRDRIGWDGDVTTHYISPRGKYLGSETTYTDSDNKKTTVTVLATDEKTLQRLWPDADLTRPEPIETPENMKSLRDDRGAADPQASEENAPAAPSDADTPAPAKVKSGSGKNAPAAKPAKRLRLAKPVQSDSDSDR